MFAPPDAEEAAFKVELASDEVERAAKKRASIPPVEVPAAPPPAQPRAARDHRSRRRVAPAARGRADSEDAVCGGVLVAIVVGFVPATLLASAREQSAYAEIDRHGRPDPARGRHARGVRRARRVPCARARAQVRRAPQRARSSPWSRGAVAGGGVAFGVVSAGSAGPNNEAVAACNLRGIWIVVLGVARQLAGIEGRR